MYSELSQTSKMDYFSKIANDWKLSTFFKKHSILDVWHGPEYIFQAMPLIKNSVWEIVIGIRVWNKGHLKEALKYDYCVIKFSSSSSSTE